MGLRFRKSVKAGPFKMTFSKSGIGGSVGVKGFRVTKKAGGGVRTTASIPGTGISYVSDYGSKKTKKKQHAAAVSSSATQANVGYTRTFSQSKSKMTTFILCVLFGYIGTHRFYVGKTGTGILWLFTSGLFMIGWIADCIAIISGRFLDGNNQPLV